MDGAAVLWWNSSLLQQNSFSGMLVAFSRLRSLLTVTTFTVAEQHIHMFWPTRMGLHYFVRTACTCQTVQQLLPRYITNSAMTFLCIYVVALQELSSLPSNTVLSYSEVASRLMERQPTLRFIYLGGQQGQSSQSARCTLLQ
jgi:hypothetical protein